MEDDIQLQKTSKSAGLLSSLGLLGRGVGVVALALGITAITKVSSTAGEMNDKIEKAAALSLEMKKVSDRIDALASQLSNLTSDCDSRIDSLRKQNNSTVEKIGEILSQNRSLIEENRKAIEEIAKRGSSVKTKKTDSQEKQVSAEETKSEQTQAPEGFTTYKIKSGDTFAKIAPKFNVSVQAILDANPNVNPARLRVGQEIVIPVKK